MVAKIEQFNAPTEMDHTQIRRSVDVYVRRIREKIEDDAETPRYLKTMRGAGYRFEIPKSMPAWA